MKKIKSYKGYRTKSGYHTGYALILKNGIYYISQESGTRKATKKEIEKGKKSNIN